jgi:hypothetical protein
MFWAVLVLVVLAALVAREVLTEMRNRRGLYDWPLWVQPLICLAIGVSFKWVGRWPSEQAAMDDYWSTADPSELTPFGLRKRAEARERLGLD